MDEVLEPGDVVRLASDLAGKWPMTVMGAEGPGANDLHTVMWLNGTGGMMESTLPRFALMLLAVPGEAVETLPK
jgi:hypothetical protein